MKNYMKNYIKDYIARKTPLPTEEDFQKFHRKRKVKSAERVEFYRRYWNRKIKRIKKNLDRATMILENQQKYLGQQTIGQALTQALSTTPDNVLKIVRIGSSSISSRGTISPEWPSKDRSFFDKILGRNKPLFTTHWQTPEEAAAEQLNYYKDPEKDHRDVEPYPLSTYQQDGYGKRDKLHFMYNLEDGTELWEVNDIELLSGWAGFVRVKDGMIVSRKVLRMA